MRLSTIFRVGLLLVALTEPLFAPPIGRPAPHFEPHVDTRNYTYGTHTEAPRTYDTKSFEFATGYVATSKDQDDSQPFVYCALPRGDAYEHTFGDRFTASKESEMRSNEETARSIHGVESRISNDFRREDLLAAIVAQHGKRPFILVCHTEGPNENRDIPLGDSSGAKISEDDLRSICAANDTELMLVSCYSKDLNISQEISYGEAFHIVKLAMDRLASSSDKSIGSLKAILRETAEKELKPGVELRVSFGADKKHVVIVTATGGGGSGGNASDPPWWFTVPFDIFFGIITVVVAVFPYLLFGLPILLFLFLLLNRE